MKSKKGKKLRNLTKLILFENGIFSRTKYRSNVLIQYCWSICKFLPLFYQRFQWKKKTKGWKKITKNQQFLKMPLFGWLNQYLLSTNCWSDHRTVIFSCIECFIQQGHEKKIVPHKVLMSNYWKSVVLFLLDHPVYVFLILHEIIFLWKQALQ